MISGIVLRVALVAGFALAPVGQAGAQSDAERGRALVAEMCGACHAIGKTGASPNAAAPAFRRLDTRVDLDAFADQLREGLQSTHPDMPSFRFSRADARAVVAYLRSIQAP
jgi:mono/diheme cytochrome c family protein